MRYDYHIKDGRICDGPASDQRDQIQVFISPDERERRHLIDVLRIDEHTLQSSLDPDEISRLEFEPEHAALIFKRPQNAFQQEQLRLKVGSEGLFLFRDRLVVVMNEDIPLFAGKPFMKVSSLADLTIKLIYRSIFHFLEHLKIINQVSDDLEKKVSTSMENRYLLNLFSLGKSLVYYLNAIHGNGVLITKIKNSAAKFGFTTEEQEFLDDMLIENNQCYRQAEIYSNVLAGLMDARVSIVNNNLNTLMKTLNLATIGIMVPTFVVSAFSMNVPIPFSQYAWSFYLILALAGLSMIGLIFFWRFKHW